MQWTKLPEEDVIYVTDDIIFDNPITQVGSLYIERSTKYCKVGNGKRYNSVAYTPWSISTSVGTAEVLGVVNFVQAVDSLNTTKKYIWSGDSNVYPSGSILTYTNSIWIASTPNNRSFAWVTDLYQLYFYSDGVWNLVAVNTHNTLFGLQGGKSGEYYHLTAEQWDKVVNPEEGTYITVPTVMIPNANHVVFSNGNGGSFTNGIKTDQYDHLDLNQNRIKNAIIDCGAFYE